MKFFKTIDEILNDITMYRLLVYGLSLILACGTVLNLAGRLPISALSILLTSFVIITVGIIADRCLPVLWGTTSNKDSSLITCLILCFILPPSSHVHDLALLGLGALIAITSKYILTYHYKHIFNPAALAALILGLTSLLPATWWVGSPAMLPITLVFGLLVLRKVRRFQLFFSFLIASMIVGIHLGLMHDQTLGYVLSTAFKSSPLIFLGTIMLTEPSTTPPRIWQQRIYGFIVGALFMSELHVGIVSATPELALLIGNIYSYIVSPKYKLKLQLKDRKQLAPNIFDFTFAGANGMKFSPGQYLEWTLPNVKTDSRGNRRSFSIASASGENDIHIGVKVSNSGSNFKRALLALEEGEQVIAGQLAGDFVLPKNQNQKLVFMAGGIGITPFVSMAKHLIKSQQKRDIILLYFVADPAEFCYQDVWRESSAFGLKVMPVADRVVAGQQWPGLVGVLTPEMLTQLVPDFSMRRYYLSGPSAMVDNYSKLLRKLHIKKKQIVTDYFFGY